ncbi:hypothetical protein T484DRAFT_2020913, partial [Baffinella frigidus]
MGLASMALACSGVLLLTLPLVPASTAPLNRWHSSSGSAFVGSSALRLRTPSQTVAQCSRRPAPDGAVGLTARQKGASKGLDSIFKQASATFMVGLFLAGAVIGDPAASSAIAIDSSSMTAAPAATVVKKTCGQKHWSDALLNMASAEDTGGGFSDLPPCLPWSTGPCVSVDGPCFAEESGCGPSFEACTK